MNPDRIDKMIDLVRREETPRENPENLKGKRLTPEELEAALLATRNTLSIDAANNAVDKIEAHIAALEAEIASLKQEADIWQDVYSEEKADE
jgi:uncharacterized small protein (DUF1192 family)